MDFSFRQLQVEVTSRHYNCHLLPGLEHSFSPGSSILVAVGTSIFNFLTFVCTSQIVAVMFSVTKGALGKV